MNHDHDYLIIGSGPEALQLAYHFERSDRSLEACDRPGAFFAQYPHPRHRRMISNNKVHSGYYVT